MSPEHNESLNELEIIFSDPFIERTLDDARRYNQLLLTETPSQEQKTEIIKELDGMWGAALKSRVKMTGNMRIHTPGQDEPTIRFVDGEYVTSNGFAIIDEPVYQDGELTRIASRVTHHMYVPSTILDKDDESGAQYEATADIEGSFLEMTKASPERALALLTYTVPAMMEDAEARLFGAATNAVDADAIMSLKGFEISSDFSSESELIHDSFLHYLNNVIELDATLPYEMGVDGQLYVYHVASEKYVLHEVTLDKTLVFFSSFEFDEDEMVMNQPRLLIKGTLVGELKNDENFTVKVPVDSMTSLKSLREQYASRH